MPELTNCPSTLAKGFTTYSPAALKLLFDRKRVSHILPFESPQTSEETAEKFLQNRKRISISGMQEKLSLLLDQNKLRLTLPEEKGTYILKPIPRDVLRRSQVPANEHLTMQIAKQVYDIETAANALIFFEGGEPAYLTRRFDVNPDGTKRGKEDFASLAGKTDENHDENFKYEASYEEIGNLIKEYVPSWKIEIEKFFRIVVFNFLFMNGDAHLKNFSVLETEYGDYTLAPSYDLLNTRLHAADKDFALDEGLFNDGFKSDLYQSSLHPAFDDFAEFGKRIGIPESRIDALLAPFLEKHDLVEELTLRSFLNDDMKQRYITLYRQQCNYLNRKPR